MRSTPSWNERKDATFEDLLGKHIVKVEGLDEGSECVRFYTDAGVFVMFHSQDCCESVFITDITGDIVGLTRGPVTIATVTNDGDDLEDEESYTWTFYTVGTVHGTVTIRWLGVSNGYYSESVDFCRIKSGTE